MTGAPHRIATDRLILTAPRQDDLDDMMALWGDPSVMQYIGAPLGRAEVWGRLLKYAGHWALFGFGYWLVRERAGGRFVGEANLSFQQRSHPALPEDEIEGGWLLAPAAQGKGYAGETLAALLDWADDGLATASVRCLIDRRNAASFRLAERHGFNRVGMVTTGGEDFELLRRGRRNSAGQENWSG